MPCVCEAVDFWLYWLRYALNNPLIYTDPSGYKFKLWKALLFAPFGLAAISPGTKYASGEASLGQAVGEYVVNAAAFIASGSIGVSVPGIDGAILGGMASGAISGGGMVAVNGGNFEDIIGGIAMGANIGALAGTVSYGVIAGLGAAANGLENARFGSMDLNAFGDFGGFRINNGSFQWMPAVNGNIFNGVGLSLASAMSSGLAGVSASNAVMGLIPSYSNGNLFQPVDLASNIYNNLLLGYKYIYHYSRGTLPDYEMRRWSSSELQMHNVFNFDQKGMIDVGWEFGNGVVSGPMYFGRFSGGTRAYLGQAYETINELDPTNLTTISKINILAGPGNRRVGYIKYYKRSLYYNALKYIYSPW